MKQLTLMFIVCSFFISISWINPLLAEQFFLVPAVKDMAGPGRGFTGGGQDLHIFQFDDLWGFIDVKGNIVIPPIFAKAANFSSNGLATVTDLNGGVGLVDSNGAWFARPGFTEAQVLEIDGEYAVTAKVGDFWGALDETGQWLLAPRFSRLFFLSQKAFAAKYLDQMGLVSAKDGWLLAPAYADLTLGAKYEDKSRNLIKINQNKKLGLADLNGKIIIAPEFDVLTQVDDNLDFFIVQIDDQIGVIDIKGQYIVPLSTLKLTYNKKKKEIWQKNDNARGLIYPLSPRSSPRALTLPEIWAHLNEASYPLAPCVEIVLIKDECGCDPPSRQRWKGYCDAKGKFIHGPFEETGPFADYGLALVKKNGRYGYIDPKGQAATPFKFEAGGLFYEPGIAAVKANGLWGLINAKGAYLIEAAYLSLTILPKTQLVVAKKGSKYAIFRVNGSLAYPPIFDDYRESGQTQKLWVKYQGFWGLIDSKGQWKVTPKFDEIGDLHKSGMMPVKYQGKYALIDEQINFIAYTDIENNIYVVKNGAGQIIWPIISGPKAN
ncbi:MAG: WG repeat-containing protein [Deltaproteobacteria bacterium]|jgi:cytochrome c551/c552|nr:WG repeat-containing protein [Deltaproteobacteria bacterium]